MASAATLKRILKEHQQLLEQPIREFCLEPLEANVLEWHFTIVGPPCTPYSEGLYHGQVLIPNEYPFAPPDVVLLTPNGRFELGKKICLSISSYHPENWHPTWGVATVLHALRNFMETPGNNGIGAIEYPELLRKELAIKSRNFVCPYCRVKVRDQWENILSKAPPATDVGQQRHQPPPQPPSSTTSSVVGGSTTSTTPTITSTSVPLVPNQEQPVVVVDAKDGAALPVIAAVEEPLIQPPPAPPLRRAAVGGGRRGGWLEIPISIAVVDRVLLFLISSALIIVVKKFLCGELFQFLSVAPQRMEHAFQGDFPT